jgi:hypothetical protein
LRDFPGEIKAVRFFLKGLRKRFGKACRIIYKHGNHEERYEAYMRFKCPEFLGIENFEWKSVFGLDEHGIELIGQKRPVRIESLNGIHGHEYVFAISDPVNPARGLFLRAKTHAFCNHFHQSSSHSEKDLNQKVVTTWSIGCLCQLHPEYRPLNPWNHGFATIETDADGGHHVENLKIIGGKVYQ